MRNVSILLATTVLAAGCSSSSSGPGTGSGGSAGSGTSSAGSGGGGGRGGSGGNVGGSGGSSAGSGGGGAPAAPAGRSTAALPARATAARPIARPDGARADAGGVAGCLGRRAVGWSSDRAAPRHALPEQRLLRVPAAGLRRRHQTPAADVLARFRGERRWVAGAAAARAEARPAQDHPQQPVAGRAPLHRALGSTRRHGLPVGRRAAQLHRIRRGQLRRRSRQGLPHRPQLRRPRRLRVPGPVQG